MNRSTALRRSARKPSECTAAVTVPVNKLTAAECARVLDELNSARFVDCAPLQVWATLLDEGTYLCSVSTMYRILTANKQVKGASPAGPAPQGGLPGAGGHRPAAGVLLGHHQTPRPGQGDLLRRLRDDRHLLALHRRGARARPRMRVLATEMMEQIFGTYGIPHVVHADREPR